MKIVKLFEWELIQYRHIWGTINEHFYFLQGIFLFFGEVKGEVYTFIQIIN